MARHSLRFLAPISLTAVLAAGGCVDDQELLIVNNAIAFDDECTLSPTATPLAGDQIDVSFDAPIGLGLVVENLQTKYENSNTGLDDDGEIKLERAEVTLSLGEGFGPVGGALSYEVPIPTDSVPSGEQSAVLITLPSSVTASLRGGVPVGSVVILQMSVVIVGERTTQAASGKLGEVRTREYTFPFEVCNGCMPCTPNQACGLVNLSACVEDEDATDTTTG